MMCVLNSLLMSSGCENAFCVSHFVVEYLPSSWEGEGAACTYEGQARNSVFLDTVKITNTPLKESEH